MNTLSHYFTLPIILAYMGGIVTGQVVQWAIVRHYAKKDSNSMKVRKFPYQAIVFVIVLCTLGYIMVSTNEARQCAIKLNVSVSVEQDIAKIERDALANAIIASQAAPAEIRDLPQSDPARKAIFDPITERYLSEMKRASDLRTANQAKRADAENACGN